MNNVGLGTVQSLCFNTGEESELRSGREAGQCGEDGVPLADRTDFELQGGRPEEASVAVQPLPCVSPLLHGTVLGGLSGSPWKVREHPSEEEAEEAV